MATRRHFLASTLFAGGGLTALGAKKAFSVDNPIGKDELAFLRDMLSNPSPSGYEKPVQKIWAAYAEKFSTVTFDTHGNAIGTVNPKGRPRLMLAGHCDELGFQVKYINDNGYIFFGAIGGFDQSIIPGRRVRIYTKNGPVAGVIGKGPIHLMDASTRGKASTIDDVCIDIGSKSKEETVSIVRIGDPVTYTYDFMELRNGRATARGFDDRLGAFIVAEVLRATAKSKKLAASVFGVSTVQEEIGLRGANTSAFGIDPYVGVAVDVTHATDYPGISKKTVGDIKLGGGAVIARGPNINPRVFDLFIEAAEANNIPYQIEAIPRGTGTDANAIQLTRAGVATGLISIPLRYMHTPVETMEFSDVDAIIRLITAFAERLTADTDLTP